jgi:predicted site-specific integrase-resolvase
MADILALPQRPLITGRELAERLGLAYQTIKVWSSKGKLSDLQIRIGTHAVKYDPEQVEHAIRSGRFAA